METEIISISSLRANLKKALDQLKKGKSFVITSRGKPIGKLTPLESDKRKAIKLIESIKKTTVIGDIVSPLNIKWDTE